MATTAIRTTDLRPGDLISAAAGFANTYGIVVYAPCGNAPVVAHTGPDGIARFSLAHDFAPGRPIRLAARPLPHLRPAALSVAAGLVGHEFDPASHAALVRRSAARVVLEMLVGCCCPEVVDAAA